MQILWDTTHLSQKVALQPFFVFVYGTVSRWRPFLPFSLRIGKKQYLTCFFGFFHRKYKCFLFEYVRGDEVKHISVNILGFNEIICCYDESTAKESGRRIPEQPLQS